MYGNTEAREGIFFGLEGSDRLEIPDQAFCVEENTKEGRGKGGRGTSPSITLLSPGIKHLSPVLSKGAHRGLSGNSQGSLRKLSGVSQLLISQLVGVMKITHLAYRNVLCQVFWMQSGMGLAWRSWWLSEKQLLLS